MCNAHSHHFKCDLDAFAGNSGSPVFREDTHEVVGILCVGNKDYVPDPNYGGESVTRYKPNTISVQEVASVGYETSSAGKQA